MKLRIKLRNQCIWGVALAVGFASLCITQATAQTASNLECNRCVDTEDIDAGAVSTSRIRSGAVTQGKIADKAVAPSKIKDGAVRTRHIRNRAVTTSKIADGAITADKLSPELSPETVVGGVANVDCDLGDTISAAIATGAKTIIIQGFCPEDVSIAKDDVTLTGKIEGTICNESDPSISAGATIDGTISVDGVRARLEFLAVTGVGQGVLIDNRADAELFCNDIFDNQEGGIEVGGASNAVLEKNFIRGNGRRDFSDAGARTFFDVGLFVGDSSHVQSNGNSYLNNQYAAIEVDRQSSLYNGSFLPRASGYPADPSEKDTIVQRGATAGTDSCFNVGAQNFELLAIEIFNDGLVDLRNADVCGGIEVVADSSFRIDDGGGVVEGNILNQFGSQVRIRDRSNLGDGRQTTFEGVLTCFDTSLTFFSDVACGQTCDGTAPLSGSCSP